MIGIRINTAVWAPALVMTALMLSGCSISAMQQSDQTRRAQLMDSQDTASMEHTFDGRAHFEKGMALLEKTSPSQHEMYFARSAFERAAILLVDDTRSIYLAGYTNFVLGQYLQAYQYFLSAAELDDSATGWYLASLSALKLRYEVLAQSLFWEGAKRAPSASLILSRYMESLFVGDPNRVITKRESEGKPLNFRCDSSDDEVLALPNLCEQGLPMDVFIIERVAEVGSTVGQDLLAGLGLELSGSVLDYSRTWSTGDTGSQISRENQLTIDLPALNYSLSFARDAEQLDRQSSTASATVGLDNSAKLALGQGLQIIGTNANGDLDVEEDVGITIELSLTSFSEEHARIVAKVEFSELSLPLITTNFVKVEVDRSTVESSGLIPYNSAFLLGTMEMTRQNVAGGGQKGLRHAPVLGNIMGQNATSMYTSEYAVLLTVRPPNQLRQIREENLLSTLEAAGVHIPALAKRHARVHQAPELADIAIELGWLPGVK